MRSKLNISVASIWLFVGLVWLVSAFDMTATPSNHRHKAKREFVKESKPVSDFSSLFAEDETETSDDDDDHHFHFLAFEIYSVKLVPSPFIISAAVDMDIHAARSDLSEPLFILNRTIRI